MPVSESDTPQTSAAHVHLTDGSHVDVYLDGERMEFRDGHDDAVEVAAPFQYGMLVVTVSFWGGGMRVSGVHLDDKENHEHATVPFEFVANTANGKLFLADDERYGFEIELRRERGNSA